MEHWRTIYEPALSASIRTIAWYPLWCDTPGVVSDLSRLSFSYSGGAGLVFENGKEIFLTWFQKDDQFCLSASHGGGQDWIPNSLDRIQCSWEEPWGALRNAKLLRVGLYALAGDEQQRVIGVRHELVSQDKSIFVWIGVGRDNWIGDADDLWVSIGIEPDNLPSLVEVFTL